MKIGFLTQARPETLARIPQDIPHVVAHADQDGAYAPDALEKLADVDALMVSAEPVHAQLLAACPRVKIVQRMGVGYNTLNLKDIAARGVPACNVAGVNKVAVAEHTMAMMLALSKNLGEAESLTRACDWPGARLLTKRSFELNGKTLGIVGLGDTGSALAQRAKAFQMRLLYNDVREIDPAVLEHASAEYREKDDLFAQADLVAICTDLNPTTRNMVDARRMGLMKPSAYLLCCARGEIVDEAALRDALNEDRLAGAAVDVFSVEPPPADNPLLHAKNILLTAHVAGVNPETSKRAFDQALDNVCAVVERGEAAKWVLGGG